MKLKHARGHLELDRCLVMGIVNRTPDSFYDGGRMGLEESVAFAQRLVDEGADLLDLGAVKAGPGPAVTHEEEAARLLPLVEAVAERVSVPLSVETADAALARRAIEVGAAIVNDVTGLLEPQVAEVCAASGAALVLMHNGGQIRGRPRNPRYSDVVAEVTHQWGAMATRAAASGVGREQLVVDPGLDFGKTTYHSLEIIRRLDELLAVGLPLLLAPSRKDVVGETLDVPLDERLEGTLAVVALAVAAGVHIVRVHDVQSAVRTVAMTEAIAGRRDPARPLRGLWD